jgi:tetratricopeptide (TPR) repeat protein
MSPRILCLARPEGCEGLLAQWEPWVLQYGLTLELESDFDPALILEAAALGRPYQLCWSELPIMAWPATFPPLAYPPECSQPEGLGRCLTRSELADYIRELVVPLPPGDKTSALSPMMALFAAELPSLAELDVAFIGRRRDRLHLQRLLDAHRTLLIQGAGGLGKTSLLAWLARRARDQGARLVKLYGVVSPEVLVESVFRTYLDQVLPDGAGGGDLPQRFALMLRYLEAFPTLIVLDNFEDNQFVDGQLADAHWAEWLARLVVEMPVASRLIITSRRPLALPGLVTEALRPFQFAEAWQRMVGLPALRHLPFGDKQRLIGAAQAHPRTLELLDALAQRQGLPVLREALAEEPDRPDIGLLRRLWHQTSPVGRHQLVICSLFEGRLPLAALPELGVPEDVAELAQVRLVLTTLDGFAYVHRLTAEFVRDQVGPNACREQHLILGRWYAARASRTHAVEDFFSARFHFLQGGDLKEAAVMTFYAQDLLKLLGYIERARALNREIIAMTPDPDMRGACWHNQGIIEMEQGNYDIALMRFQEARSIFAATDNHAMGTKTAYQLGMMYQNQGHFARAEPYYQEAQTGFLLLGDQMGLAAMRHQQALMYQAQGQMPEAFDACREALELFEQGEDENALAGSCSLMGSLYHQTGHFTQALHMYQRAAKLLKTLGYPTRLAAVYGHVAMVYGAQGKYAAAERLLAQALDIFTKLGYVSGRAATYGQYGALYIYQQAWEPAEQAYLQALDLHRQASHGPGMAATCGQLALLALQQRQDEQAFQWLGEAWLQFARQDAGQLPQLQQVLAALLQHQGVAWVQAQISALGWPEPEQQALRVWGGV